MVTIFITLLAVLGMSRELPAGPLILGYTTLCEEMGASANVPHLLEEARRGVNVILWSPAGFVAGPSGTPEILLNINTTCIAVVANTLKSEGLETVHLLSIGGWNGPHPSTEFSSEVWWEKYESWNK